MINIPDDEETKLVYPMRDLLKPMECRVADKVEAFGVINVLTMLEGGATLAEIGRMCDLTGGSVTTYFTQLGKKGDHAQVDRLEKRRALWIAAKKARAQYLAESTLEIADTVEPERDAVAKANLRIATRKWMAASADPEEYGTKKDGPLVQITITEAFLQSLKADPSPRPPAETVGDGGGASPVRLLPAGK